MVRRIVFVLIPFLILVGLYFSLKEVRLKGSDSASDARSSKVVVYTYSSFASSWGAGSELKKLFNELYQTDLEFVDTGEAGVLLQRLALEGEKSSADVVLGLDQFILEDAVQKIKWKNLSFAKEIQWDSSFPAMDQRIGDFGAYNWAPMTFIYREKEITPPRTLMDLLSVQYQKTISLMDPRSSSPGYIFFHWIVQKLGPDGAQRYFKSIQKDIVTVSPSWSSAYGLFTKKQAKLVFSYLTSPVYHWVEDKNLNYKPVYLNEPIPYHVEYVGIPDLCKNCEGAQKFIHFLYTEDAQRIIMTKNYMLPVVANVKTGTEFDKLKAVKLFQSTLVISRAKVIEVWKSLGL